MAFVAALQVTQGADYTQFTIADISDYNQESKSNFSARTLLIYQANGEPYLQPGQTVPQIDFNYDDYPDDTINIIGLIKDQAFKIVMTLTPIVVDPDSVYVAMLVSALTGYTMSAFYDRAKKQSVQPRYETNIAYTSDTHKILIESELATHSAAIEDIDSAQLALDRAARIIAVNVIPY